MLAAAAQAAAEEGAAAAAPLKHSCPEGASAGAAWADVAAAGAHVEATAVFAGGGAFANQALHAHSVAAAAAAALAWLIAMHQHTVHALLAAAHHSPQNADWWIWLLDVADWKKQTHVWAGLRNCLIPVPLATDARHRLAEEPHHLVYAAEKHCV